MSPPLKEEDEMKCPLKTPTDKLLSIGLAVGLVWLLGMGAATPRAAAQQEEFEDDMVALIAESIPAQALDVHLSLYYDIEAESLPAETLSATARLKSFREKGLRAYQDGDYEEAIKEWDAWLAEDPENAEVMDLLAQTYIQKGQPEEAVRYYEKCLEYSPGQIKPLIRYVKLLEDLDRDEEVRELLNTYARIFPENPDILIAQAQWLDGQKRRIEARRMVETLVAESPMNLEARLALLNLQDEPADRYHTLRSVLAFGYLPDSQLAFGQSMQSMDMITYPESGVFFDYIRRMARRGRDSKQKELYENFLPITNRMVDDFTTGELSGAWVAPEGVRQLDRGRYELRTAMDQFEAYLRLRRSDLLRDGYLEVMLDESQGFFWLYARRSGFSMVRFGFDQENMIHLQTWYRGNIVNSFSRPWIRPPGTLRMRMEIRGDGVRGFVNDLEIFDAPVEIPAKIAYGRWGIAPFAFDLGMARARIMRLDVAPLPTNYVFLPPGDLLTQIAALRPFVGAISALCPAWGFQNPDGSLPEHLPEGVETARMFAAYHRIRLLPVLDLAYQADIPPAEIIRFITNNYLSGVIVKTKTLPDKKWVDALTMALEAHPANVVLLQTPAALWEMPVEVIEEPPAPEWVNPAERLARMASLRSDARALSALGSIWSLQYVDAAPLPEEPEPEEDVEIDLAEAEAPAPEATDAFSVYACMRLLPALNPSAQAGKALGNAAQFAQSNYLAKMLLLQTSEVLWEIPESAQGVDTLPLNYIFPKPGETLACVAALRPEAGALPVMYAAWGFPPQDEEEAGEWEWVDAAGAEQQRRDAAAAARLLATYPCVRLLPALNPAYQSALPLANSIQFAERHHVAKMLLLQTADMLWGVPESARDDETLLLNFVFPKPGEWLDRIAALRPEYAAVPAMYAMWDRQPQDAEEAVGEWAAIEPVWELADPEPWEIQAQDESHLLAAYAYSRLLPLPYLAAQSDVARANSLQFAVANQPAKALLLQSPAAQWDVALAQFGTHTSAWQSESIAAPETSSLLARAYNYLFPKSGERLFLQELPIGSVLVAPINKSWSVPITLPDADAADKRPDDLMTPRLYLMGPDGQLAMPLPE